MATIRNPAREKLEQGALSLGCGVRLTRSVEIGPAMKSAGFDWLFIDCEHGTMSLDAAAQIAVAALDAGIAPIVRVPNGEYSMATRVLDNGALGIVMPHVDSADEAAEVVQKLKYQPVGHRSMGGIGPHYSLRAAKSAEAAAALNAANLTVVMLETPTAIANAEAIAAVPGVDVLLIGTNDLCAEMGIHGDFGNARVTEAYAAMIAACKTHHKFPGMAGVYDETLMARYIGLGARFILSGNDANLLSAAATARAGALRKMLASKLIVLFTDFGLAGPYTGQMKAVLARDAPAAVVVDLFADAPSARPQPAACLLAAYAAWFPPGAVFLCVVDPGVGGPRAPLIVRADRRWYVGPDNGLFELVLRRAAKARVWRITFKPASLSASFHGRDLFAPVAARLARGDEPPGKPHTTARFLAWPDDLAEIVYVDHYGNAITGLRAAALPPDARLDVAGEVLPRVRTFSDVPQGAAFCYENANGLIEVAVNGGRADAVFGLTVGSKLTVVP